MTKALYALEDFARAINNLSKDLPKSRSRCFDIGTWGGCGVFCPVFVEGGCDEPQEISVSDIINKHGNKDSAAILAKYDCFLEEIVHE